jgi:four helix bundle protein
MTNHQSQVTNHRSIRTHKDLDVWKQALDLSADVYRLTEAFHREEIYGLSSQMRRASVSVASNIAEGAARRTDRDFIHFLHVALGSTSELDTQAEIAIRVGHVDKESMLNLQRRIATVARMLYGLIRSVERKTDA